MDAHKILSRRELIQFELDGKAVEKTLKPLKNKQLVEMQAISDKMRRLPEDDPKIEEYDKRTKEIMLKESFIPPFTDEELDEIETPTLLEIMERVLVLNGLEKAMAFQERMNNKGATSSSRQSPQEIFSALNKNPSQKIM